MRLQAQESLVQVAHAGAAHAVGLQLVVAAGFVQGDARAHLDLVARARHEPHLGGAAAEHDGAHRGTAVLEREIPVARGRLGEIGNLAAHPQRRDAALQQLAHSLVQLGNCQDIPREYVVCDRQSNCHKGFRADICPQALCGGPAS
ncbi:hypothetical protein AZ22_2014 [Bordetella bronchiseptica 980-2]|nr:hypothetical protein AZ22_2014 [Bordetella bronchiseptica 980-2]